LFDAFSVRESNPEMWVKSRASPQEQVGIVRVALKEQNRPE
jgi:hypothetical protein